MSIEDKELDGMFHGEEKPLHPDTVHITVSKPSEAISKKETTTHAEKTAQKSSLKPTHDFRDGKWVPLCEPEKPEPNWMDKLKDSAKWAAGFGGLSFLLFYWEQAGLMAESIAVPSMCICTLLVGWGAGRNAR